MYIVIYNLLNNLTNLASKVNFERWSNAKPANERKCNFTTSCKVLQSYINSVINF